MQNTRCQVLSQFFGELYDPFRVTGGTKPAALAGKRQEHLMAAAAAPDPGEPLSQSFIKKEANFYATSSDQR